MRRRSGFLRAAAQARGAALLSAAGTRQRSGIDAAARQRIAIATEAIGPGGGRQIACANTLVRLLRDDGIRAVYAHFASLPSTLGWLAAAALKLPFLISAHARDVFVDGQALPEKLAAATRAFTCNQGAFQRLSEIATAAGESGKVTLMRHGLPLEQFDFRPQPTAHEPPRFLCAGRMVEKKGFGAALEALNFLKHDYHLTLPAMDRCEKNLNAARGTNAASCSQAHKIRVTRCAHFFAPATR